MSNSGSKTILKNDANRRVAGPNWNNARKSNVEMTKTHENNNKTFYSNQSKFKKVSENDKYVAMDCEMVGIGYNGRDDMLARVSIVNRNGEVLLDKYVKPRYFITNYRTSISGIRPCNLENAEDFDVVKEEVVRILQNRFLVGHSVSKDLKVLHIKHPFKAIRDTSNYKPLCNLISNGRTPSLKLLSQVILGIEIQNGEHNSIEDARAAMSIYNRFSSDWEQYLRNHEHNPNRRKR